MFDYGTTASIVVGGLVTIFTGFYAVAKIILNQSSRDRDADRSDRKELTNAIKQMARSHEKVASATARSADEAKQRNGHLAELVLQGNKLVEKDVQINSGIRASLEKSAIIAAEDRESLTHPIENQHIEQQVVQHQQVVKEDNKQQ